MFALLLRTGCKLNIANHHQRSIGHTHPTTAATCNLTNASTNLNQTTTNHTAVRQHKLLPGKCMRRQGHCGCYCVCLRCPALPLGVGDSPYTPILYQSWHGSEDVTQGPEPLMRELPTMATVLDRSQDWRPCSR